jgi:hypothetical protein
MKVALISEMQYRCHGLSKPLPMRNVLARLLCGLLVCRFSYSPRLVGEDSENSVVEMRLALVHR